MSTQPSILLSTLRVWMEDLMPDGVSDRDITAETQAMLSALTNTSLEMDAMTELEQSRLEYKVKGRLAGARVCWPGWCRLWRRVLVRADPVQHRLILRC